MEAFRAEVLGKREQNTVIKSEPVSQTADPKSELSVGTVGRVLTAEDAPRLVQWSTQLTQTMKTRPKRQEILTKFEPFPV